MRTQSTVCFGFATRVVLPLVASVSASGPAHGATAPVPTFTRDVAPILYKNCTHCHRDGEIAPMPLLSYEDARPNAKAIVEEVEGGSRPPWHADSTVGHFKNDRRLSDADPTALLAWAKNGAPKGNPADLPPPPNDVEGGTIGRPDAVLHMPVEYKIPDQGQIEYEYFEIPTNFTDDQWVQGAAVK